MKQEPWMQRPLEAFNDIEGEYVPPVGGPVVDAHVHVFPDPIFKAVWEWFGTYGWPIRYQMTSENLVQYLLSRGISHVVALQYAHKSGIARGLNQYMAGLCDHFPGRVTGMATILPGEPDTEAILKEAFAMGLGGVKLHTHVQCFDMNSRELEEVCDICAREGKPMVIHAGREPKSAAYKCDPYQLCSAEKLENLLRNFPDLRICVPHLGMDEFSTYQRLIEIYDTLWLDTTMAITDFLPVDVDVRLEEMRTDRIMYGTDFPNIPYAWDRELKKLLEYPLSEKALSAIMHDNAVSFFNIAR